MTVYDSTLSFSLSFFFFFCLVKINSTNLKQLKLEDEVLCLQPIVAKVLLFVNGYVNGYVNFFNNRIRHRYFLNMVHWYGYGYFFDMMHWNRNWNGYLFDVMHRHVYLLHVMMMNRVYVIGHVNNVMFTEVTQLADKRGSICNAFLLKAK